MSIRLRSLVLLVGILLASGLTTRTPAQGSSEPTPIPVDQEPRHRILFSDARLRVLQVNIPAGDTTLEHNHTHDLVTVNVENGPTRTRDHGAEWSGVRAREIGGVNVNEYTGKPLAHTVQTVGDRAYRLTGVENLKDAAWTSLAPLSGPYLTVVAEGRAFRAYELRLPASAAITHVHSVPVVITLVSGTVTASAADAAHTLTVSGEWNVVAAGATHRVQANEAGARVVELEVR